MFNCKICHKRYFKLRYFFLINYWEILLEITLGISIAKQGRGYILNCDRKFFAELERTDLLISTTLSESQHEYRNCNCVILVKSAT